VGNGTEPVDALLGPLHDMHGATPYHPPLPGSPAVDAIPIADCAAGPPFATDQRGVLRPRGPGCDIGAVEITACENGLDDDGDGSPDYPADPGCRSATSTKESPQCSDGRDNDGDGKVDWDGGPSGAAPDIECDASPWRDREVSRGGCGLGA